MLVDGEAAAGRETAEVIEETLQKHANEAGWDGDGQKAEKENGLITRPSFHIPFFFPDAHSRGVRVTHCEAPLTPLAGPGIIRLCAL